PSDVGTTVPAGLVAAAVGAGVRGVGLRSEGTVGVRPRSTEVGFTVAEAPLGDGVGAVGVSAADRTPAMASPALRLRTAAATRLSPSTDAISALRGNRSSKDSRTRSAMRTSGPAAAESSKVATPSYG